MKFNKWQIYGFFFTILFGTLLHFVYGWSGQNEIVGIFAPVNESTWEHLKLLFMPMLAFTIFELFTYGKMIPCLLTIRFLSILVGIVTIIVTFYTYTGIIGENFLPADIATFILGIFAAYCFSFRRLQKRDSFRKMRRFGLIGMVVLLICFVFFTFSPPHLGLFQDPITKSYGIM